MNTTFNGLHWSLHLPSSLFLSGVLIVSAFVRTEFETQLDLAHTI